MAGSELDIGCTTHTLYHMAGSELDIGCTTHTLYHMAGSELDIGCTTLIIQVTALSYMLYIQTCMTLLTCPQQELYDLTCPYVLTTYLSITRPPYHLTTYLSIQDIPMS